MIRPKTMADGTVRFQVYGRRNGKQVYIGTVDSERDARKLERKDAATQDMIAAGELPPEIDRRRTFGAAVRLWLDALDRARSRSATVYRSRIEAHAIGRFEHVPIVGIAKTDILRWRDELLERVAASTANSCTGAMSSAFSWFVEQGWLASNPCIGIRRAKHIARVFPWLQTSEAITRLLAECSPAIRTIVAVLVGTGLRLDEALHLRWDDVDLDHRIITVHRGRKGTTKAGRHRRVPIFDSVLPVLQAMRLARGGNLMLWPGAKPGRALAPSTVRVPFKDAVEHAELDPALRLHDLRHTFASLFLADGGDIFKLSKILGHHSVAMTEKIYAHLMPTAFEADYGRVRFRMPYEAPVAVLRTVAALDGR